jgi:MarR family transcriptional regulator, negative regulator of the multidrug operon emrRAB
MSTEPDVGREPNADAQTIEERRIGAMRERYPAVDFADLEVALTIGRASVVLDRALAEVARPYGLTPVALQTLISVFLAGTGPLSLSGLGDELRVTKANVSLVLAGLEKQKLIRRHADPSDGRKIRATVTEPGAQLLAEIIPLAAGAMKERLSALSADDRTTLQRLARDIR